jgi:hypothetical protein
VEILRAQAATVVVVRECGCSCATIDLGVDPSVPDADGVREPNAVEAHGRPRSDGRPPPDLILFVRDGRLASLEIVSYPDAVFDEFPPPADANAGSRPVRRISEDLLFLIQTPE